VAGLTAGNHDFDTQLSGRTPLVFGAPAAAGAHEVDVSVRAGSDKDW
jgi:hypothetical protein